MLNLRCIVQFLRISGLFSYINYIDLPNTLEVIVMKHCSTMPKMYIQVINVYT